MGRKIPAISVVCTSLLGCASVFMQTDDFPDKLQKGCGSLESCQRLETEAKARIDRCQENTIGYIKCSDARADLTIASGFADMWRAQEKEAAEARFARNAKKEQEAAAEARRKEEAAQRARDEEHRQHFEQQERERAEIIAKSNQEDHDRELKYLRLLGPAGREKRVRTCVEVEGTGNCADLVMLIGEAIGDEKETARLARVNETPPVQRAVKISGDDDSSGGGGSLLCCDGSLSPSCSCGGSHRGCCSHHGGVCGCQ